MRIEEQFSPFNKQAKVVISLNDDDLQLLTNSGILTMKFDLTTVTIVMDKDA